MKVSFSKVITKKWKSHLELWVTKRHLHGWLLAKPIHIYIERVFSFLVNGRMNSVDYEKVHVKTTICHKNI